MQDERQLVAVSPDAMVEPVIDASAVFVKMKLPMLESGHSRTVHQVETIIVGFRQNRNSINDHDTLIPCVKWDHFLLSVSNITISTRPIFSF